MTKTSIKKLPCHSRDPSINLMAEIARLCIKWFAFAATVKKKQAVWMVQSLWSSGKNITIGDALTMERAKAWFPIKARQKGLRRKKITFFRHSHNAPLNLNSNNITDTKEKPFCRKEQLFVSLHNWNVVHRYRETRSTRLPLTNLVWQEHPPM